MPSAIRTAEELEHAGDIGRCELIRGELIMMMPPGGTHGKLAAIIAHRLAMFLDDRNIGTVLGEAGFVLSRDPDTVRAPDAAFLRTGREIVDGFIEGAPELAIEVVSPSDRPGEVREKVAQWLESGAEAVWVIEPRAKTVTVHEGARGPRLFEQTDTLDGGSVLPGFALELRELFA